MKKYKALVLEDLPKNQIILASMLEQFDTIDTKYVNTPFEFLEQIQKRNYQLFVIDLVLKSTSFTSIDLMQAISDPKAWVVMLCSKNNQEYYEQYRGLKFKKFVVKKPIDEYIFKTNIESFLFSQIEHSGVDEVSFLMLKLGNFLHKVQLSDINLIQTDNHTTTIFTEKHKFTTYGSLSFFEGLIKNANFQKINRNSLVNVNGIKRINLKENYVEIADYQVPISRARKPMLVDKYLDKKLKK